MQMASFICHLFYHNTTGSANYLVSVLPIAFDDPFIPVTNNIANVGVAFKLATKDPNGNCTNGIIRHYDVNTNWDSDNFSLFAYTWPRDRYLNIYIVKKIIGMDGAYAFLPGDPIPPSADVIVCMHNYVVNVGTTGGVDYRVLTHEVGHFFSLEHVWGVTNSPGVACGDDNVSDTPSYKRIYILCYK